MNKTLDYLRMFTQFPLVLRRFSKRRLTLGVAKDIVRRQIESREQRFLRMIERGVYAYPPSPYRALLEIAGCGFGDLQEMVQRKGLETTLRALRESGVFVTFEEFKGRKPIVRHGREIPVQMRDFDNPLARRDFAYQTGGSTGIASSVAADLDHMAARAVYQLLTLDAHGMLDAPSATWHGILPHHGVGTMLRRSCIGPLPERWFSPIGWRDSDHWLSYSVATCYIILWMRLLGLRVPLPEIVKVDQALVVARWLADTVRAYQRCVLHTQVSRAVRVCIAAQEAGLDLTGATIKGGGEPPTPAKVQHMERAGVHYIPSYGMTEAGSIASGCARPIDGSDVHLFTDAYAMFSYPHRVEGVGVTVPAFNLTTLLPTAPKLMLNAQMDDYGIIEERNCGCELQTYGYTTHLRQIRSYSKLTGEGVSLIATEMVRILEEVLPDRFGGTPLDYQMLEQEDEQGLTRLYLVISPRVQIADESLVIKVVLNALRRSSPMADTASAVWQHAQTLQVRRLEPTWTMRGKLMPLHIRRRPFSEVREEESQP
ncbi:MAG: hypothetical protein AMJ93_08925 [Anaerolineae bacterium SM23_84]|nr:MAG: hypothetical protein AMJ93_08925 [Anaerolineae bacterium SM23_84]